MNDSGWKLMSNDERAEVSIALNDWFRSQHVRITDAVPIMALTIVGYIRTMAENDDDAAMDAAQRIADVITKGTKAYRKSERHK